MQSRGNSRPAVAPMGWSIAHACDQARRLCARIVELIDASADAYAAGALYAELSRLSDAELARRGIPRGELHRHVFETLRKR
jgi:hypothetical protein